MKHTYLLIAALPSIHPLLNVPEVTPEKFSTPTVQFLMSQTLGSLNPISPNFYKMYRNDCQLLCLNQDCDLLIHFQKARVTNEDLSYNGGQITAKIGISHEIFQKVLDLFDLLYRFGRRIGGDDYLIFVWQSPKGRCYGSQLKLEDVRRHRQERSLVFVSTFDNNRS